MKVKTTHPPVLPRHFLPRAPPQKHKQPTARSPFQRSACRPRQAATGTTCRARPQSGAPRRRPRRALLRPRRSARRRAGFALRGACCQRRLRLPRRAAPAVSRPCLSLPSLAPALSIFAVSPPQQRPEAPTACAPRAAPAAAVPAAAPPPTFSARPGAAALDVALHAGQGSLLLPRSVGSFARIAGERELLSVGARSDAPSAHAGEGARAEARGASAAGAPLAATEERLAQSSARAVSGSAVQRLSPSWCVVLCSQPLLQPTLH